MKTLLYKIRLHHLRRSYEELLRAYTRDTGKHAGEALAVEVLVWAIKQDIGQNS